MFPTFARRHFAAVIISILCVAALPFMKGVFVSAAGDRKDLPLKGGIGGAKKDGRADTDGGMKVSTAPALFFPAIGTGATGADLFMLEDLSAPQPVPVRTDPGAGFGSNAGYGGGFRELNDNLYFFADTATEFGPMFQRSAAGVLTEIPGVNSTGDDAHFTYFDHDLYFRGLTPVGNELVRLDRNGVITPIDVNTGAGVNSFAGQDGGFGVFDGGLYFSATTPATGSDLFRLDAGSTTPVSIEIDPGAQSSFAGIDNGFHAFNNRLYFNAFIATDGQFELMQLAAGSSISTPVRNASNNIITHNPGVNSTFYEFAGSLYTDDVNPGSGDSLIKIGSNGIATPIQYMGADLNNAGQLGGFVEFGGELYFSAVTPATAWDLFKISAAGTVTAINLTNSGSFDAFNANNPGGFVVFNGALYFAAYNAVGDAFYKLDGGGTVSTVLNNGTTYAGAYGGYKVFAGSLYFSAFDQTDGYELFKLDTAGTLTDYNIKSDGTGNSEAGNPGGFAVFPGSEPTAASVPVAGRVATSGGRAISGARVVMDDGNGNARQALTNAMGYYRFEDVRAGRGYTFSVVSKGYLFSPMVVTVGDELTGLDFIGVARK